MTVSGPTGGPPFDTFLIGRPTGTRPPIPVARDTPRGESI